MSPIINKSQLRNRQKVASFKKGNLKTTKNYRSIILTAKIYNALLLNHISAEVEKVLRKNQSKIQILTLSAITAKIYNALLLNHIQPEI